MPTIRITVDGKPATTLAQAAERRGMLPSTLRAAVFRLGLKPVAHFDGRTPLYVVKVLDAAIDGRPGKGRR